MLLVWLCVWPDGRKSRGRTRSKGWTLNEKALKNISRSNVSRSTKSLSDAVTHPKCPHCGGLHMGQRFDDCPYVKLAVDETATEEQQKNAAEWLRLHKEEAK